MSDVASEFRECPYCKEEIKADAVKCKHCHSTVQPKTPPHRGTCPYCKEDIKPDAIKCKHCGSMIGGSAECGCHQEQSPGGAPFQLGAGRAVAGGLGTAPPIQPWAGEALAAPASCSQCSGVDYRVPGGRITFGIRFCCKTICVPFFGCGTVCWPEPCYSISLDPIIT